MSKLTVDRKAFERALTLCAGVTPRRTNIPAVCNVLIRANGDVRVAATDLEYGTELSIPRKDNGAPFEACLPVPRLLAYVKLHSGEIMTLENVKDHAALVSLDAGAKLVGIDPNDFPSIPDAREESVAELPAPELARAFNEVKEGVSTEVVRYALTGVLVETKVKGNRVRFVASDGKRLASTTLAGAKVKEDARIIVPTKTLYLIARSVRKSKGKVSLLKPDELNVKFRLPEKGLVFSRLIEGHFPDYEAVMPSNLDKSFKLNRVALIEAVRNVLQWTTDKTKAVKLTFAGGKLTLWTRTQDVGEGSAEIAAPGKGEDVEAIFNPDYILDFLRSCVKGTETVTVKLKDRTSAAVFEAAPSFRYVLMPLTINL